MQSVEHLPPLMQRLFDCQQPAGVRISPAAQSPRQLVYQSAPRGHQGEHTKSSLWLADHGVEHSARQLTSGLYNDHSPRWTPSGKSIVFISDRAKAGKSSALYCLNLAGGEAYPLTPTDNEKSIEQFEIDPRAGNFIAYLSPDEASPEKKRRHEAKDDADVYGEDVPFQRLRLLHIASRDIQTLFAQDRHATALSWTRDSSSIVLMSQDSPEVDETTRRFSSIHPATRKVTTICDFDRPVHSGLVASPNGVYFIAGIAKDTIATACSLYELNIETETCTRIDNPDSTCTIDLFGSASTACVVHAVHEKSTINIHAMTPLSLEGTTFAYTTSNTVPASDWALTTDDADTKCLGVLVSSSPSHLPEVVSVSQSRGAPAEQWTAIRLSQHTASVNEDFTDRFWEVHASAPDGPRGILHAPKGVDTPDKLPCLVHIHGGPYSRAVPSCDPTRLGWGVPLRAAGFGILSPNYSGSMGRGDAWARRAAHAVGTVDYDDVLAVVDEAIAKGWIDKDRLVVGGWSQGGFLSYCCATRNASGLRFSQPLDGDSSSSITTTNTGPPAWRFKGAICGAGVSDWDMLTMTSDVPAFEAALSGSLPWRMSKADTSSRRGSPVWEMAHARAADIPPVLILHGKEDARCPWTQALAFSRACRAKGVACEFVTYPREPHAFGERAHLEDMAGRVLRFVQGRIG